MRRVVFGLLMIGLGMGIGCLLISQTSDPMQPGQAVAQESTEPDATSVETPQPATSLPTLSPETKVYEEAYLKRADEFLESQVNTSLEGLTIEEALEELSHLHDYPIIVDEAVSEVTDALESEMVERDYKSMSIRTFLDTMLGPHDLAYAPGREHFIITTVDETFENPNLMSLRIYDCRDLLAQVHRLEDFDNYGSEIACIFEQPPKDQLIGGGYGSGCGPDDEEKQDPKKTFEEQLARENKEKRDLLPTRYVVTKPEKVRIDISVLAGQVMSQSGTDWEDAIGEGGSITTFNGMLVVRQTEQGHHKVERFLNLFRQATIGQSETSEQNNGSE